jgi:hypothetical protein
MNHATSFQPWRYNLRGDKYVTVIMDLTPVRDRAGPVRDRTGPAA